MQHAPSQFSPRVGERRSGLFTFPLCAKLSWFLAMNKMHTHARTRAHTHTLTLTDIHACAHTNTHSVSTPALVSHSRRDVAHKQEIGKLLANSISPFDLKYTKKIYPPKHFSVYFPHCKHFCYYKIWHVILIGRDTPYQTYGLYRGLGSHYGKNANGLS